MIAKQLLILPKTDIVQGAANTRTIWDSLVAINADLNMMNRIVKNVVVYTVTTKINIREFVISVCDCGGFNPLVHGRVGQKNPRKLDDSTLRRKLDDSNEHSHFLG